MKEGMKTRTHRNRFNTLSSTEQQNRTARNSRTERLIRTEHLLFCRAGFQPDLIANRQSADFRGFEFFFAGLGDPDIFHVPKGKHAQAAIGKNAGKGNGYQATFSNVYTALEYELSNMIFTAGILVIQRLVGAGRGGRMSPFAARVTCMVQNINGSWPSKISYLPLLS